MNRPFSAFAALLALLALAMFAVSSTSRSTTVQRPRREGGSTVSGRQLGGTNFVFIIPAAAAERMQLENTAKQGPIAETACSAGCGMQCAAEFFVTSQNAMRKHASAAGEQTGMSRALAPARVLIAEHVALAATQRTESECRGGDDLAPEGTVQGTVKGEAEPVLGDAELLSIFQDFGAARRGASTSRARGVLHLTRVAWMRLASQAAAAESRLKYKIGGWVTNAEQATPSDSDRLAWDDYAALIDGALEPGAATAVPASSSGVLESVRFSDWLRHSAASSLLQWGRLLQATAVELEQPSEPLTSTGSGSLAR